MYNEMFTQLSFHMFMEIPVPDKLYPGWFQSLILGTKGMYYMDQQTYYVVQTRRENTGYIKCLRVL